MDVNNILLDESRSKVLDRIRRQEDNTFMSLPPPISETDGSTANMTQDSSLPGGSIPDPFPATSSALSSVLSSPAAYPTSTPAARASLDNSPPNTISSTTNQTTIKALPPQQQPQQPSFKLRMRTQQQQQQQDLPFAPSAKLGQGVGPRTPLATRSPNIKTSSNASNDKSNSTSTYLSTRKLIPPSMSTTFTPKPKSVEFATPKPPNGEHMRQHLLSAIHNTQPHSNKIYRHQTPNPPKVRTPHPLALAITAENSENTMSESPHDPFNQENNDITTSSGDDVDLRQADTSLPLNGVNNGVSNHRLNTYLNKLNQDLSAENQELAARNKDAMEHAARLEMENNELKAHTEEARAIAERLDSEYESFKERVKEQEMEIKELKKRIQEYESENVIESGRHSARDKEQEILRDQCDNLQKKIQEYERDSMTQRRRNQENDHERELLQDECNDLKQKIEDSENEKDMLTRHLHKTENECEMLRDRIEQQESELDMQRRTLEQERKEHQQTRQALRKSSHSVSNATDSPSYTPSEYSVNKSVRFQPNVGIRTPKTPGQFNISKPSSYGDMTLSPLYEEIEELKQAISQREKELDVVNGEYHNLAQQKFKLEAALSDVPYLQKALCEVKKDAANLGGDIKSILEKKNDKSSDKNLQTHHQLEIVLHKLWIDHLDYCYTRQSRFIDDLRAQKQYFSSLLLVLRDELIDIQDQLHEKGFECFNFLPDAMPYTRYQKKEGPPTLRAVALAVRFVCSARSYYSEAKEQIKFKEDIRKEYGRAFKNINII